MRETAQNQKNPIVHDHRSASAALIELMTDKNLEANSGRKRRPDARASITRELRSSTPESVDASIHDKCLRMGRDDPVRLVQVASSE